MNEQLREVRVDPKVLGSIRRATLEDMPFFLELIRQRYGDRFHEANKDQKVQRYLASLFDRADYTCLRGAHTAGAARIYEAYDTEPHAQVVAIAAWPQAGSLEPLRMLRVMLLWARAKGVSELTLSADSEVDFAPFAERLGGVRTTKVIYKIPTEQ